MRVLVKIKLARERNKSSNATEYSKFLLFLNKTCIANVNFTEPARVTIFTGVKLTLNKFYAN